MMLDPLATAYSWAGHIQVDCSNRVSVCLLMLTRMSQIVTVGHSDLILLTNCDHKAETKSPGLLKPAERHCPWTACWSLGRMWLLRRRWRWLQSDGPWRLYSPSLSLPFTTSTLSATRQSASRYLAIVRSATARPTSPSSTSSSSWYRLSSCSSATAASLRRFRRKPIRRCPSCRPMNRNQRAFHCPRWCVNFLHTLFHVNFILTQCILLYIRIKRLTNRNFTKSASQYNESFK